MLKRISPCEAIEILSDEELFSRVSDDSVKYENLTMPNGHIYIGIFINSEIIGFWWLHPENATTWTIHANILKNHRSYGKKAGKAIIDYVKSDLKHIQKLNAKIPVTFPEVYHYTINQGFKDEGLDRKSILKDGKLLDRHILGMTREEF